MIQANQGYPHIRTLRRKMGMTQEKLADVLGIDNKTISRYEGGMSEVPLPMMVRIADIFGTSIDELVGRTPPVSVPGNELIGEALSTWQKVGNAFKTLSPEVVLDGISEEEAVAIAKEGQQAVFALQRFLLALQMKWPHDAAV